MEGPPPVITQNPAKKAMYDQSFADHATPLSGRRGDVLAKHHEGGGLLSVRKGSKRKHKARKSKTSTRWSAPFILQVWGPLQPGV